MIQSKCIKECELGAMHYSRSWNFNSKSVDSLTASLGEKERQDLAELQLARPWVNLEYLSEITNFYGT